jgi:predicted RNase H-like HicB family nuclease
MTKYEIIVHWSDEDQVFVAELPELPGSSAHGSTQEAALASVQEATRHWIDTAREFGDPIPEPRGRRLISARNPHSGEPGKWKRVLNGIREKPPGTDPSTKCCSRKHSPYLRTRSPASSTTRAIRTMSRATLSLDRRHTIGSSL